ncbi:unnamed protein product [Brugia timori]|uniref:PNPLA domain-containing protein n=1 Tax=Brugia timori TaxID=42155 RepID=A0A0R3QT96_9BILA|nr:unnamed protein product [Brugia timori]
MSQIIPFTFSTFVCAIAWLIDDLATTVNVVEKNFEIVTRKENDYDLNSTSASINHKHYGATKCNIPSNTTIFYSQRKLSVFNQFEECLKTACCWNKRKVKPMRFCRLLGFGCGFLGVYHFGVLKGLNRDGKALMKRVKRCAGASAGALAAALWTFQPDDAEKGFNDVIKMATEIHSLRFGALSPDFALHRSLQKIVDFYIPEDISNAQDKLYISLTDQKKNVNRLISKFTSRNYLIDSLLASCYIPFYSGSSPPVIDGDQYIDGGFTNNLPVFEELPTITISPFSGSAIIAPNDYDSLRPFREWRLRVGTQELKVNVQNMIRGAQALFPPNVDVLKSYYEMGQRDAMRFLLGVGILERQLGDAV